MAEDIGQIVELTLRVPDHDEDAVTGLVNLGAMAYALPIAEGRAVLTRIHFPDGSHVDVTESLADLGRMLGIPPRRPQRQHWGTTHRHPGALPTGPRGRSISPNGHPDGTLADMYDPAPVEPGPSRREYRRPDDPA
ncbi:MAG: hypothetical protein M3O34_01420 [Chloroflexota bacterium]|nr:hypothetical protein [Chloroflexota bacterium]